MISYCTRSLPIEIDGNASASRSETPHGDHSCDNFYVAAVYLHEISCAYSSNTVPRGKMKYVKGVPVPTSLVGGHV